MKYLIRTISMIGLITLGVQLTQQYRRDRDFYQQMAKEAQAGDVMYADPLNRADNVVYWQMSHYLPATLYSSITGDIEQARAARRVW